MKKALVVGINNYPQLSHLHGCVNDANRVAEILKRNGDGSKNFDVKEIVSEVGGNCLPKRSLKYEILQLFETSCDVALFYFAGHGYADEIGGYLITSDCSSGDDGISVSELSNIVQTSNAKNKIIILDCCQAGSLGKNAMFGDNAIIPDGTTYLLACKENQYSEENKENGVFTNLLIGALSGGAANLVGEISPGSIYAYIDQALGLWQQRPVFKTNVEKFISIRNVKPPIDLADLRKIIEYFPDTSNEYPLDPSYEPSSSDAKIDNNKVFSILQKYNRLNLLVPVGEEHMYYAAINSKSCKLTALGVHYWNLVKNDRI